MNFIVEYEDGFTGPLGDEGAPKFDENGALLIGDQQFTEDQWIVIKILSGGKAESGEKPKKKSAGLTVVHSSRGEEPGAGV